MKELEKIVEEVYKVFSGKRPGEYIDACTHCCMSEEDAKSIKTFRLEDIPLELLEVYQDAAKPEKLNLEELKYFAPRYLELLSEFKFPSFEPLLSLSRFGYFIDEDWTKEERELLDRYAMAFYKKVLKSKLDKDRISPIEMLIMFKKGNFKIEKILEDLESSKSPERLSFFSGLLNAVIFKRAGKLKVDDAFADKEFNEQICNWIESDRVKKIFRKRIEEEIMDPTGFFKERELKELSWNYEMMK